MRAVVGHASDPHFWTVSGAFFVPCRDLNPRPESPAIGLFNFEAWGPAAVAVGPPIHVLAGRSTATVYGQF